METQTEAVSFCSWGGGGGAETGTSIMPRFSVDQYGALNHFCYILIRVRLHTCLLRIKGGKNIACVQYWSHTVGYKDMLYDLQNAKFVT